jgi:hypothetical protein
VIAPVTSPRWTRADLENARRIGDPEADAVIAKVFQLGDTQMVSDLLRTLVVNDGLPSPLLPEPVRAYLVETGGVPPFEAAHIATAQRLFALYGPEMLFILGLYALPASYAAAKGVRVLHETGFLQGHTLRRLFETTQMVVDVLSDDGLGADGKGVRTAQKVRLMHASIRHLMQAPPRTWDTADLGVPINQEDLAGTLMTFSVVVLRGLARLGIQVTDDEKAAYLHCWLVIGRIMGITPPYLPADLAEADELTLLIRQDQIAASRDGRELTAALVAALDGLIPHAFSGFSASAMRFFLEADELSGQDVPKILGLPHANWTELVVWAMKAVAEIESWLSHSRDVAGVIRWFSRHYVDALLAFDRGGNRPPFSIPDRFRQEWAKPIA